MPSFAGIKERVKKTISSSSNQTTTTQQTANAKNSESNSAKKNQAAQTTSKQKTPHKERDFLKIRKHFRRAVDERNTYYEDYKKQSKWKRLKWAVNNPLAWAFGRTESNQAKTKARMDRKELLESLDPNTLELKNPEKIVNKATEEIQKEAETENTQEGSQAKGSGAENTQESSEEDSEEEDSDLEEILEAGNKVNDKIVSPAMDLLGDAAESGVLGVIKQGSELLNGADEIFEGISDVREKRKESKRLKEGGDKQAALAKKVEMVGSAANVVGTGGELLGLDKLSPVTSIISDGAQVVSGAIEVDRTRKIKSATKENRINYEQQLEQVKKIRDRYGDSLSEEDKKKLDNQIKTLESQISFMRKGHNTARVDQTKAGWDMVEGGLKVGSTVAELAGSEPASMALGMLGSGAGFIGKQHVKQKAKALKHQEVDRQLNMQEEVEKLMSLPRAKEIGLTEEEAKIMVLKRNGYSSYSHAYLDSIKKDVTSLRGMSKEEQSGMIGALGLDAEKAKDDLISERLGATAEQAADMDKAIEEKNKKGRMRHGGKQSGELKHSWS